MGPWCTYTLSSVVTFSGQHKVITDSSGVYAYTKAESPVTAGGYVGARAALFTESGACVYLTSYKYNPSNQNWVAQATNYYNIRGNYYSHGYISYYTGDGYIERRPTASPRITY